MTATRLEIQSLIDLTAAVQNAVASGAWDEASQLEAQRSTALMSFVDQQRRIHGDLEHLRTQLTDIQRSYDQLIGRMHHHQRTAGYQAAQLKQGKTAVESYLETTHTP
jgi:hypothetical protein